MDKIKLIEAISNLLGKLIWFLIILIILAIAGRYFIFDNNQSYKKDKITKSIEYSTPDWNNINQDIVKILKDSYDKSYQYTKEQLQQYGKSLKERIDNDFINWYFSYWTQQELGLKGLLYKGWHWFDSSKPDAKERITQIVQEEFAKRVLRPQISQMLMEQIMQNSVKIYLDELHKRLSNMPKKYNLTQEDWNSYLQKISIITINVNGNRNIELSLKALVTGTVAGSVKIMKLITPFSKKIGSKVAVKVAEKGIAKMATKTATKVMAKFGGEFLGSIAGIGIIIWDIWDHSKTRKENEPILRKNLHDYVDLMIKQLLDDPTTGLMVPINKLQEEIINSLKKATSNSSIN